jgi:predicted TIM-barrel fold metal-dependent hydrolase
VIDTCIHHEPAFIRELLEYLPGDWAQYVGVPGSLPGGTGAMALYPSFRYPNPAGDYLADAYPADGTPPGSSREVLSDALDARGAHRAILLHGHRSMFTPALPNPYLGVAAVRALNDWTVDRWLTDDDRLFGAVVVPTQLPNEAAAEIRRAGGHEKMVAVLLAANGLGKLFGHPVYHPIFEAAAELDLPVVIHRGGDAVPDSAPASAVAGGPPLSFVEYSTVAPVALFSHILSIVSNGVLLRYPNLRICVTGAGVSWVPGMLRRLELAWTALRREVPWVKESPTETFHRQVRVSTYGLERDGGRDIVRRMAEQHEELGRLFVYGSGYPSWDTLTPADIKETFPAEWHERILSENAEEWFRWPAANGTRESVSRSPREAGRA